MPFEPVIYRIKVKPDPVEEVTAGGIILSQSTQQSEKNATVTGIVVGVGPSAFEGEIVIEPGDRILYAKYGGMVFYENGQEYRFMSDEDIIAIYREEIGRA
jgi:chaperonin GroES